MPILHSSRAKRLDGLTGEETIDDLGKRKTLHADGLTMAIEKAEKERSTGVSDTLVFLRIYCFERQCDSRRLVCRMRGTLKSSASNSFH